MVRPCVSRLFRKCGRALRRDPLFFASIAAIAGVIVLDRAGSIWWAGLSITLVFAAFLAGKGRKTATPHTILITISCIVMGFLHSRSLSQVDRFPLASEIRNGSSIEINGTGCLQESIETGVTSTSLQIDQIALGEDVFHCNQVVPVWIQKPDLTLPYGSRVSFSGLLRPLGPAKAPGGFSPRNYHLRNSGTLAELVIREGDDLIDLEEFCGSRFIAFSRNLRLKLEAALHIGLQPLDEPYARTITAMALGVRENTPEEIEELFQKSGTLHLFAVSGMHVGVVAGLLLGAMILLRIPKDRAVLIVIPLILFYAVLTGLRPSAVRAAVMLSLFLAAYPLREQPRLLNSLGAAALLLLVFDTQQIFLPGFQLSFAVLLAIALLVRPLQRWIGRPFEIDSFLPRRFLTKGQRLSDFVLTSFSGMIAISVSAWIGSLPLLIWHFQVISPIGLLANLVMIPLAGVVLTLAVCSLISAGFQVLPLTGFLNQLTVGSTVILTTAAQFFASIPGASWNISASSTIRHGLQVDVMGERGELGILIRTTELPSSAWMIDTGGLYSYRNLMLPTLRSRGINHLDALFLSHNDSGHNGAVQKVIETQRPGAIFGPPFDSDQVELTAIERYDVLHLHPGVTVRVLSPAPYSKLSSRDDNALVLKIENRNWSILYTSDIGFAAEKELISRGINLEADIWIRGQNRDSLSGTETFVEAIHPTIVISTQSEFPASEQIPDHLRKQLDLMGSRLFELDKTGVVSLGFDSGEVIIEPYVQPQESIRLTRDDAGAIVLKVIYKNID